MTPSVATREDLVNLIQWLALPYAFDPVFRYAGEEAYLPGYDPAYKDRLQATWEAVVGTKGPGPDGKAWGQCTACGMWQIVAVDTEEESVA